MTQYVRRRLAQSVMDAGGSGGDAEEGGALPLASWHVVRPRRVAVHAEKEWRLLSAAHRMVCGQDLVHAKYTCGRHRTDGLAHDSDAKAGRAPKRRHRNGLAMLVVPYLVLGPWLQRHGVLAGWRGQAVASAGASPTANWAAI